jgi:aminopeptidase N
MPTPGQAAKEPFVIPVSLGLLSPEGQQLPLQLAHWTQPEAGSRTFVLTQASETFTFVNLDSAPVPSLLRGFSAPVVLRHAYSDAELAHLMAHDSDSFNRWEAGQRLALNVLMQGIDAHRAGGAVEFPDSFIAACARLLDDAPQDPAFAAEALSLPAAGYLAEQFDEADPDAIFEVRTALRRTLAARLEAGWRAAFDSSTTPGPYSPDAVSAGRRALRNLALGFLMELEQPTWNARCLDLLLQADNMTDAMAALSSLANADCPERSYALNWFYERWQHEPLVLDKWFAVQASSRLPGTLAEVRALLAHPAFDLRNPNKVRALIGAFCQGNHVRFHAADGSGYVFAAEQIMAIDPINAQVAARMARAFDRWRKFDSGRQAHAKAALLRISETAGLSKDTVEVVSRALA